MHEQLKKKINGASFFDLDGTLINGNSGVQFAKFLYRRGKLPLRKIFNLSFWYVSHKLGIVSIQKLQESVFSKYFKGLDATYILEQANLFVQLFPQTEVNTLTLKRLKEAKLYSKYTIILSSSPDFLVSLFAKKFEVDSWASTVYEIDFFSKKFDSIKKFMLGVDKATYIQDIMSHFNLNKNQITAYTDSIYDLPMLEVSGIPIGVNPDRDLRKLCKHNSWEILE